MNFKKILFVMSFTFIVTNHCFPDMPFLRKTSSQKKIGLTKIGTGIALLIPCLIESNSTMASTIQVACAFTSGSLILNGALQFGEEYFAKNKKLNYSYTPTPHLDKLVQKIASDEQFLVGAILAASGMILHKINGTEYPSDTVLVSSAIGLAFMAASICKPLSKDYLPLILSYLNK